MRPARLLAAPVAISAILLGIWIAPNVAGAAPPDLSSVVLPQTLPGLVADPPGPTNGPITQANASVLGASSTGTSAIKQQLANGDLSGYLRVWTRQPHNGDDAVILALNISDPTQVGTFLAGFNHGESSVATSSFSVPGISGASGFLDHRPESGQPATEYSITFARGNTVFEVDFATITGDITLNDAVSVAARQAANTSGPVQSPVTPSGSVDPMLHVSYVIGEVMFWVVVILLPLGLIQRHRRKKRAALSMTPDTSMPFPPSGGAVRSPFGQVGNAPAFSAPHAPSGQSTSAPGLPLLPTFPTFQQAPSYPPATSTSPLGTETGPPAGWYPDPRVSSLQRYFDGHDWTEHTAPR